MIYIFDPIRYHYIVYKEKTKVLLHETTHAKITDSVLSDFKLNIS